MLVMDNSGTSGREPPPGIDTSVSHSARVHRLLDALPSGSYLVLCDPTTEVDGEAALEACRLWNESGGTPPLTVRSRLELIDFFDGMELLDPGVVSCSLWRPGPIDVGAPIEVSMFGGVGRKP